MTSLDLDPATARAALAGIAGSADDGDDETVVADYARAIWSMLAEPGDGVAGRLVDAEGASSALRVIAGTSLLPDVPGLSPSVIAEGRRRWLPRLGAAAVDGSLRAARAAGIRLVTPADPAWPPQLADLGDHRPLALWVRGDPARLMRGGPSVALVGARAATSYGEHVATEFAADLAGDGLPIVSGAAYGIDGAAHSASLAVGGTTIALLAGGVDRPYPAGHAGLLERIAQRGAVISEVPCGGAPTKWRFLQRNRVIAALSDATVVIEAGRRSGSLNTAGHAAALGRPLGAVPGPVTSAASAGCHRLLREFAAECVTTPAEVRELLGFDTGASPSSGGGRTGDASRIVDALSTRAWRLADDVARRSGLTPRDAEAHLGLLLLTGDVERSERGWRLVVVARS